MKEQFAGKFFQINNNIQLGTLNDTDIKAFRIMSVDQDEAVCMCLTKDAMGGCGIAKRRVSLWSSNPSEMLQNKNKSLMQRFHEITEDRFTELLGEYMEELFEME